MAYDKERASGKATAKGGKRTSDKKPRAKTESDQDNRNSSVTTRINRKYVEFFLPAGVKMLFLKNLYVNMSISGDRITFEGDTKLARLAAWAVERCIQLSDDTIYEDTLTEVFKEVIKITAGNPHNGYDVCKMFDKTTFKTRTDGQDRVFESMRDNDVSIVTGAAGSGKTTLAIAYAYAGLCNNRYNKIILTRPVIETGGERMGFLPGTADDKVAPYMVPMLDALNMIAGKDNVFAMMATEKIMIVPLAYIRGRTFDNAYIVADEMQNSNNMQMLTLLTRIGYCSKIAILGDLSQTDSGYFRDKNGLNTAMKVFEGKEGASLVKLGEEDIQRSWISKAIVSASVQFS